MNETITSGEFKDPNVIAELNTEIAKKTIKRLRIFNHSSLICSLDPSEISVSLEYDRVRNVFSMISYQPYLYVILFDNEFSSIEINEVDWK